MRVGNYGTDPAHGVVLGVRHVDRQGIKALKIVDGLEIAMLISLRVRASMKR